MGQLWHVSSEHSESPYFCGIGSALLWIASCGMMPCSIMTLALQLILRACWGASLLSASCRRIYESV
eukprot:1275256-Amphidinium_carterae.1